MTTLVPHRAAKHSAEQIEAALVVLALESGNVRRARKKLAEMDIFDKVPPATTITRWPETYRERYAEIRSEVAPRIKARMADTHDDLATRLASLEHQTLDELEKEVSDLSGKDKAALLRNTAIAAAVHTDKAQMLRGEATVIVKRELPEIFRALAAKGVVIEGVAEEVTPPRPLPPSSHTDTPSESPTPSQSES
jgi:hypothetical protein